MPRDDLEINMPEIRLPQWSRKTVLGALGIVLAIWLATGIYTVEADELGVVLRFGKFVTITEPGLNYHWPFPIESVETPQVSGTHLSEFDKIDCRLYPNPSKDKVL